MQPDSCTLTPRQSPTLSQALLAANVPDGASSTATGALKGLAAGNPTSWFPHGPLPPNASMTDANGYHYKSDMFGRPQSASGDLKLNPNPESTRDAAARANQRAAGGVDRLPTDEGGHGIGNGVFRPQRRVEFVAARR